MSYFHIDLISVHSFQLVQTNKTFTAVVKPKTQVNFMQVGGSIKIASPNFNKLASIFSAYCFFIAPVSIYKYIDDLELIPSIQNWLINIPARNSALNFFRPYHLNYVHNYQSHHRYREVKYLKIIQTVARKPRLITL